MNVEQRGWFIWKAQVWLVAPPESLLHDQSTMPSWGAGRGFSNLPTRQVSKALLISILAHVVGKKHPLCSITICCNYEQLPVFLGFPIPDPSCSVSFSASFDPLVKLACNLESQHKHIATDCIFEGLQGQTAHRQIQDNPTKIQYLVCCVKHHCNLCKWGWKDTPYYS